MTHTHQTPLIVVVEDEADLLNDIVEELQEAGYRTAAAKDGHEALDLLTTLTPDLLLCDVTMPGVDGYGVLRAMRKMRPELATTPFVFLTALAEPHEVIEGKLLGADDYLVKPVDYELMLATIDARLRQVQRIRSRHDDEMENLQNALLGLSGQGAERALDLISLGVVLLDENGKPLHTNRAAYEMAADGDLMRIEADRVQSTDPVSDKALQKSITETLEAAMAGEEKVVGALLHRSDDDSMTSMLACALPQSDSSLSISPSVALFLSAAHHKKRAPEALLMELFGLTQTEARVAGALANSNRASDVATELGVSSTTIAFHMRNLFQKTGTNRQADLIALILAGPMMINLE